MTAERLAAAAGCSRFALYRAFRAEFGLAPSDYQRQLRLRHARRLLRSGAAPADAAAATGFADQARFSRWFQRVRHHTRHLSTRVTGRPTATGHGRRQSAQPLDPV
ncbi:helix-turn-helix transcriptional regulator [Streptomyces chrestomyceticus]|uniref:helix-turn-helix transcriptional regulator n=1 Tax=Streptomyces chrestomyceticus TaxID=68185 RepID=UPI000AB1170C